MSATNHTGNYNLPIYEAGNTANWLVDFNGAMSTIDSAMNENKLAGDTLKTDMEELQTDFQQVSTKADAAEQAATQASTNAANALTIANNATTIAGDAQVDAHAALTQIEKLTIDSDINDIYSNGGVFSRISIISSTIGITFMGGLNIPAPFTNTNNWIAFEIGGVKSLYFNGTNLYSALNRHSLIPQLQSYPAVLLYANTLGFYYSTNNINPKPCVYGIFIKSSTEAHFFFNINIEQITNQLTFIFNNFCPRRPILDPVRLNLVRNNELELYRPYLL